MVFILKSLKMELKIEIGKSHDKHEKFIIIRMVSITVFFLTMLSGRYSNYK